MIATILSGGFGLVLAAMIAEDVAGRGS